MWSVLDYPVQMMRTAWILKYMFFCVVISNAQIAGKTLFLGMSVRMFLEEINIWIGRLNRIEKWRKNIFAFCVSWGVHLLLSRTSALLVLRPSPWTWIYTVGLPWSSGLWTQNELYLCLSTGSPASTQHIMGLLCLHNEWPKRTWRHTLVTWRSGPNAHGPHSCYIAISL